MRRLWKRFNISSYQPDFAKWLIELAISEDNQQYMISAGNPGQLDDIKGMSTTARDHLSSGVQSHFDVDGNDTGGNFTTVLKNSSSDLNINDSTVDFSDRMLVFQDYVLIVLYSVTTLLAILGNSTAIVIFTKGKRSKTDLRPFLINLAVADLIMAIFCIPFTFTYSLLGDWIFSEPMCPVVMFLQTASVTGSVSTNMAIGIDRFCAITFPLNSTRNAINRYRLTILIIWLIAIALSAVQLFVGGIQHNPITHQTDCKENWPNNDLALFYTILILILTYIIPLIILTITYSIVGCILWKRNLPGNADAQRDASQLKAKSKIVKMLVTIVVLFALCWLPLHIFFFVLTFFEKEHHPSLTLTYFICHWIAMSNSFVNPIVYSLLNDSYRADFKALVLHCFSKPNRCMTRHRNTSRHGAIKKKTYQLGYGSHSLENDHHSDPGRGPFQRHSSERTFIKCDSSTLHRNESY